ncbi:MAG: cofactor-independent phosphoglycerate mutase [Chloroflexota bacterium]|nr:cofactor-independent phosphoglycerate mutase [Chloroflexota bacterium]
MWAPLPDAILTAMKYCVLIIDGAADWPLAKRGGKTCLELARTPNLDAMARDGVVGLARTVPPGMEPSSACACMSILGYDPAEYPLGRSAIEARSMGIPIADGEAVFRCNLVAVQDGRMRDYSAGYIGSSEAHVLVAALNDAVDNDVVEFYPGVSYRNICKIRGRQDTLLATCTPPHDISGRPIDEYLPRGDGSDLLRQLMSQSVDVLRDHPVNLERAARGETPATMVWLFWGSGKIPDLPPFKEAYGLSAAITSGVDLLHGLAKLAGIENLEIAGVSDGLDNDYAAQVSGALAALEKHDLVVIHVEAPDEAGHAGSIEDKVEAIQRVDREIAGPLASWRDNGLRVLAMPDHPTPIETRTHTPEPVPFVIWGPGFSGNGASAFAEAEAAATHVFIENGHFLMSQLLGAGR